MKVTILGFRQNLLEFSSFLSVSGIVTSLPGVVERVALIVFGSSLPIFHRQPHDPLEYLYLVMWILLLLKTIKKDVTSIETIATVYSYTTGVMEVIGMGYIFFTKAVMIFTWNAHMQVCATILLTVYSGAYFIFACVKIIGIGQG